MRSAGTSTAITIPLASDTLSPFPLGGSEGNLVGMGVDQQQMSSERTM